MKTSITHTLNGDILVNRKNNVEIEYIFHTKYEQSQAKLRCWLQPEQLPVGQ
jgi:hypothetical protein